MQYAVSENLQRQAQYLQDPSQPRQSCAVSTPSEFLGSKETPLLFNI